MIVDFHCHYPIHLLPEAKGNIAKLVLSQQGRWRMFDRVRAFLVHTASRMGNYRSLNSGPRVTVPRMRRGGIGVALSALYSPLDEMDISLAYPSLPRPHYMNGLRRQIIAVEADIEGQDGAALARTPAEMDEIVERGDLALVHCVEGGFHFGNNEADVRAAVTELAAAGVAYITPAHLFWRGIATNSNAIPFLPDWLYSFLWPQPDIGLSALGRAAVETMVAEGVIVDISHMSARAVDETFAILDRLDPNRTVPVVASHVACRFGRQEYNLDDRTVRRIVERGGLIGLIFAEHQAADGLDYDRRGGLAASVEILGTHVDRIAAIAGSHGHVAIGSDFDGYIKPTLAGLEDAGELGPLPAALEKRYDAATAAAILRDNALRLLREHWGRRPAPAA